MLKKFSVLLLTVFILMNFFITTKNYFVNDFSAKSIFQKAYAAEEEEDDDDDDDDDNEDEDEDEDDRYKRNLSVEEYTYQNDRSLKNYIQDLSPYSANKTLETLDLSSRTSIFSRPEQPNITMLATFANNTNLLKNIDTISEDQSIDYYTSELIRRGIISDFDPISYDRFLAATRIDGLRLILNTIGLSKDEISNESEFFDVDKKAWFSSYIATAKNKGIVKGYEDNTFKPLNGISRSEFLKMLFKAYGIDFTGQYPRTKSFLDEDDLHWSAAYLETAKANNLIRGYGNGTVGPEKIVTKGEIAKIVLLTSKIKHTQNEFKIPEMMNETERNELKMKRELEQEKIRLEQEKLAKENSKKLNVPTPKAPIKPVIPVNVPSPIKDDSLNKLAQAQAEAARIAKEKAAKKAAAQAQVEAARIAKEKAAKEAAAQTQAEAARIAKEKAAKEAAARARKTRRS